MSELRHELTLKQRKFCHYYLRSGNKTQSAIKAGYSKNSAYQIANDNLKKPRVKKYLHSQEKRISTRHILTTEQSYELLTKIALGKSTDDVLLMDPMAGEVRDKKRVDTSVRLKAIKELLNRPLLQAQIAKTNGSTRKINAEAAIKELLYKQNNSSNNQTISKVDELLDQIFKDGKN